jgi:hypothetical protein
LQHVAARLPPCFRTPAERLMAKEGSRGDRVGERQKS